MKNIIKLSILAILIVFNTNITLSDYQSNLQEAIQKEQQAKEAIKKSKIIFSKIEKIIENKNHKEQGKILKKIRSRVHKALEKELTFKNERLLKKLEELLTEKIIEVAVITYDIE
jgi:hypothetical protein